MEWERIQQSFGYYDISRQVAEDAANLQVSMRLRGRQVGTVDALIATIAIHNEVTLLTRDRDFEPIPYLQQENLLQSFS